MYSYRKKRLKMMSVFVLSFLIEESESEKYIATPENVLYLLKVCRHCTALHCTHVSSCVVL